MGHTKANPWKFLPWRRWKPSPSFAFKTPIGLWIVGTSMTRASPTSSRWRNIWWRSIPLRRGKVAMFWWTRMDRWNFMDGKNSKVIYLRKNQVTTSEKRSHFLVLQHVFGCLVFDVLQLLFEKHIPKNDWQVSGISKPPVVRSDSFRDIYINYI